MYFHKGASSLLLISPRNSTGKINQIIKNGNFFSTDLFFLLYFSLFAKLCCVENSNIFPTAKTHTEKNIICYLLIGESISYFFLCQCFSLILANFHHLFVIQNSRHHHREAAVAEVYIKNGKVLFEFDELQWCVLIHFYAWEHERGWDSVKEGKKAVGDRLQLFGAFDEAKCWARTQLKLPFWRLFICKSARPHFAHEGEFE